MDYIDYREKLGIGFSDKEKQEQFIARMQIFLQAESDSGLLTENQERLFCYEIGVQCKLENRDPFDFSLADTTPSGFQRIWLYLSEKQRNFPSFLAALVIFANTYRGTKRVRTSLINSIEDALQKSHLQYEKIQDKSGVFFYPAGAPEFDSTLINEPFAWLDDYPNTQKMLKKALQQYSDGIYIQDTADNLRKALEEFLREFLGNTKQLEANKAEIGKYLGSQNVGGEFTSLFQTVIQTYKLINDAYAKHHDKIEPKLLEFLLYQTGLLIRMVLSVKQAEMEVVTNAD